MVNYRRNEYLLENFESQNKYAIHILIPIFSLKQLDFKTHLYFFCSRFILVIT